ncbi:MAG: hypothetical protein JNM34_12170 [Chthonomonadaceae bacterium]|nr:hypothetical protein [Chthonomonadaceae bacterium]
MKKLTMILMVLAGLSVLMAGCSGDAAPADGAKTTAGDGAKDAAKEEGK